MSKWQIECNFIDPLLNIQALGKQLTATDWKGAPAQGPRQAPRPARRSSGSHSDDQLHDATWWPRRSRGTTLAAPRRAATERTGGSAALANSSQPPRRARPTDEPTRPTHCPRAYVPSSSSFSSRLASRLSFLSCLSISALILFCSFCSSERQHAILTPLIARCSPPSSGCSTGAPATL